MGGHLSGAPMAVYSFSIDEVGLDLINYHSAINKVHGGWLVHQGLNLLKLEGSHFVWEIDEDPSLETRQLHIVPNLIPKFILEPRSGLELQDELARYDQVGPKVTDVVTAEGHGQDALGLVRQAFLPEGDFKRVVVNALGITGAHGGPDVLGELNAAIHESL